MTQPFVHTAECQQKDTEREAAIRAWRTEWPFYCLHCHGYGQFEHSFDPSPAGVSLSSGSYTEITFCEMCTEQGNCARCGRAGLGLNEDGEPTGPCSKCGWNFDDGLPPPYECYCYEEEFYSPKAERDALHYQQVYDDRPGAEYNCMSCHDQGCILCMNEQDLYS